MWQLKRIFFLFLVFGASFASANAVDVEKIEANSLNIVCTIYSILAAVILAIYAIHSSAIDQYNKEASRLSRTLIWDSKKAIRRLMVFFWLYLIVLGLSLFVIIIRSSNIELPWFVDLTVRATVFFSVFSMGASFLVPLELSYIQERRMQESNNRNI